MSDHVPKAISVQNHLSKHSETNILLGPREREMLGVKKALKIARKKHNRSENSRTIVDRVEKLILRVFCCV